MQIEEHIKKAESIFIDGQTFDEERINFIKYLQTCDLLAVPGSGKTTALIAKLYCIAQNMPFFDGSGVLILAHTNHAIEEIEKKLKYHCPQLFSFPNYIGTVQSFTNKFLASPYYTQKNGRRFIVIDDAEYKRQFDFYLNDVRKGAVAYFKNRYPKLFYNSRLNLTSHGDIYVCDENSNKEIEISCPNKWLEENTTTQKIIELKEFIKATKIKLFSKGLLHYDDCYFYAKQCIHKTPNFKKVIQKRFAYVFIDEMQDLEDYQISLIDEIFFSEKNDGFIQRIGDINQSIYSSGKKVKIECDWKPRNIRHLNNSYRLTKEVARLVNGFTLSSQIESINGNPFRVEGLQSLSTIIKPHLLLIQENTNGETLKRKFEELIMKFGLDSTSSGKKNGFKIIGWNTVWDNDEQKIDKNGRVKIRLKDLFPDYSKEYRSKKEHFDCLKKYLCMYDQEKKTLESVRKSILNALVQILRIEGIYRSKNQFYRKSTLVEFIKTKNEEEYNAFKSNLFNWSFDLVVRKEFSKVYNSIKLFIESKFINWNFSNDVDPKPRTIERSKDFIDSHHYSFNEATSLIDKGKNGSSKLIEIEINSVHGVKGQTHCATMYVETAYKAPPYEILKIQEFSKKGSKKAPVIKTNPFLFQQHSCEGIEAKNALKMIYVGFSRPTHLLCFAVFKENIEDIELYRNAGWEIDTSLLK